MTRVTGLGRESVDGVLTTHFRGRLGFPVKGMPRWARRQLRKTEDDVDLWVDKGDGYIRRASIDTAGVNEETVDLSRFGEQVHVVVPPASQTIDPSQSPGHVSLSLVTNRASCHG